MKLFTTGNLPAFLLLNLMLSTCFSCRHKEQQKVKDSENIGNDTVATEVFLYLPAVISSTPNTDSATSLILSTADVARFDNKPGIKPFVNSVQIVDADMPWPPRWYTATPFYSDSKFKQDTKEQFYRFDFVIDPKVVQGYFSFYKIISRQKMGVGQLSAPDMAGYILLNEKMEPVDTVKSDTKRSNMYFHDLQINTKGERMVDLKKDTYLDLRDYTDDPKDSSVHCNVDYIHILDSNNKTIFTWNPLHHVDPALFQYKEMLKRAFASRHVDLIEFTRLSSAFWDYDGNIMYSMKGIGVGKVSRESGSVIWQINNKDLPRPVGKDTLEWHSPHDFTLLSHDDSTVTYSLFSNGEAGAMPACGVIFQLSKSDHQVKSVKYIMPQTLFITNGQGGIDYHPNGDYAIGYGFIETLDSSSQQHYRPTFEYYSLQAGHAVYQLPSWVYVYKARILNDWKTPPRPTIVKRENSLEAEGEMSDWTWYKLSGPQLTIVTKAGKGKTLKPEEGATYCVEGKYGIGFSVSRPYTNRTD